jgi:hypothetical protein
MALESRKSGSAGGWEQTNSPASALVGRWVPVEGQRVTSDFIEKRLELLKDGSGIGDNYSLSWTTENGRLILKLAIGVAYAYNFTVSGQTLILQNDDGRSVRYRKE